MSYFDKYMRPLFLEMELDETSIISRPENYRDKTRLVYLCTCKKKVTRTQRGFLKRPLCDDCSPCQKRGPKPADIKIFIELLGKDGYSLVNENDPNYINTRSLVKVYDPVGFVYNTSCNRFQQGHRSPAQSVKDQMLTIEEVRSRVEKAGFTWIEGTKYLGNHIPFDVRCHCGETAKVCIDNIRENRVGCNKCYKYNRTRKWDFIEAFAEKYGCIIITESSNYKGNDTIIEVICPCGEDMIKNVRGFLNSPRCLSCSVKIRQATNEGRYGHSNYLASDIGKESIKRHYMDIYNVDHNMKVESIQKKSQDTCFKNFGVKCILSTAEVRIKASEAFIKKWGNSFGLVSEIVEKMKATNRERYGVDYPLQSKEIQLIVKKNNLETYGNEVFLQSDAGKALMIELYGNEMFLQSETGKALMLELYGAEYAMQVPEFFEEARKSSFKLKLYVLPSGREVKLQGYEWMCLSYLIYDLGVNEDHILVGAGEVPKVNYTLDDGITHRYFMDAYITSEDRGIEVKSIWTYMKEQDKNKAKWIAASYVCKGGFDVYVFGKCGLITMKRIKNGEIVMDTITPFSHKLPVLLGNFY